jgi:ATP-dependent protease HslVU (ClpYQ) peptidase subunit
MSTSIDDQRIAKMEANIRAYRAELHRLAKAVEKAEEDAAKWRRKAKKLKKRQSTVILDAAPEFVGLSAIGDVVEARN